MAQGPAELVVDSDIVATVDRVVSSDDGKLLRDGTEHLTPTCIVDFSGLFLVRHASDGEWYMGQLDEENVIRCWSSYGDDFEEAIKGL